MYLVEAVNVRLVARGPSIFAGGLFDCVCASAASRKKGSHRFAQIYIYDHGFGFVYRRKKREADGNMRVCRRQGTAWPPQMQRIQW